MASPLRVLIAGAGYVGLRAGLLLARDGLHGRPVDVLALRRRPPEDLPAPLHPVAADLLGPDLADQIPPVDLVLYAAASDGSDEDAYRRIYVEGVDALLTILEARPPATRPRRFVFLSSTGVYGDAEGGWVDETSPADPDSWRGSIMLEGEARTLASSIPGVVLRLGGIYGPGRTRLLDLVRTGRARCAEGGPLWSNRIHREDAAGAAVHLLGLENPDPVYLGVDEEPAPLCEVYRWVADQLGVPGPRTDPAVTRDRSNKRCSSRRLRASGYTFRVPTFREGYAEMIEAEGV